MKYIVVATIALMMAACSDAPTAQRVLANQGFRNIQTTGYSWFGCSKDDFYSTGFVATAPNGNRVEGVVCSSVFTKGATVRFY